LKRRVSFYIRAATSMLNGIEAKEAADGEEPMEARAPDDEVKVSGAGAAIAAAIAVAMHCQAAGLATIAKVQTSYPELTGGRRCAQIDIHLERMGSPADAIELEVVDFCGSLVGKIAADRYWPIAAVEAAVAGLSGLSADEVHVIHEDEVLRGTRPLTCVPHGEVTAQLRVIHSEPPSFEGLWATYPCSILCLFPDGSAEYVWHDDYWNSPLRETLKDQIILQGFSPVDPGNAAEGQWKSRRGASGAWEVSGHVVWQPFGKKLDFHVKVRRDNDEGLKEGQSEWMLDAIFTKADTGETHEATTFYMMPTPPGGYIPRTGEKPKPWDGDMVMEESSSEEEEEKTLDEDTR